MPRDPLLAEALLASAKACGPALIGVPPLPALPGNAQPMPEIAGLECVPGQALVGLTQYLTVQENPPEDIAKLRELLRRPRVILEIGCGAGEAALAIARQNPELGVVASDCFDWSTPFEKGSHYGKIAQAWKHRSLMVQHDAPDNLVVLRARVDILRHLPEGILDTVLLINAEPAVGKICLDFIFSPPIITKIKPGDRQVVILPYSREMGVGACGGCQFEHDPDWSRGLGYLMGSGKPFRRIQRDQWGVDLRRFSPYSRNSTQSDVYAYGETHSSTQSPAPRAPWTRLRDWCRRLWRR